MASTLIDRMVQAAVGNGTMEQLVSSAHRTEAALDAKSAEFMTDWSEFFSTLDTLYNAAVAAVDGTPLGQVTSLSPTGDSKGQLLEVLQEVDTFNNLIYRLDEVKANAAVRFGKKRVGAADRITKAKNRLADLKRVFFGARSLLRVAVKGTPAKIRPITAVSQIADIFSLQTLYVRREWRSYSVLDLVTMLHERKLTVPPIQRGFVKAARGNKGSWIKTAGAETLIKDVMNPSISKGSLLFQQTDIDEYSILDGQQRTITLYLFWSDEIAIHVDTPAGEVKVTFSMLSNADQQLFLGEKFNVEVIIPTDEGLKDLYKVDRIGVESFLACNDAGIPLTEDEKNSARLNPIARGYIKAVVMDSKVQEVLGSYIKEDRKALTAFIIRLFVMSTHRKHMSCDLGPVVWDAFSVYSEEDWAEATRLMIEAICVARVIGGLKGPSGKFSTPLAEAVIVLLYEMVKRDFASWLDIQNHALALQRVIDAALQDGTFVKYIHVGTNNPSTIEKEVDGFYVGRYPYLIEKIGEVLGFTYSDFSQS